MGSSNLNSQDLGHYVYVYYDTNTGAPFYVGKGQNQRASAHQKFSRNPDLADRIAEGDYGLDVLAWGLEEDTAFQVEAAAIDLLGIDNLLNISRGKRSRSFGRIGWKDLMRQLNNGSQPLEQIDHNIVFVGINKTYEKYGNTPGALYDSTRGIWTLSLVKASEYQYIAGVVDQTVVSIYEVAAWLPAGTTRYEFRIDDDFNTTDRIESVGKAASDDVLNQYIGKNINLGRNGHYFGPLADKVVLDSTSGTFKAR